MNEFSVVLRLPVVWGDQDAVGHVNNAAAVRWLESVRVAYFQQVGLGIPSVAQRLGPILASLSCHYRRQLSFPDTVVVGLRATRIGNSSVTLRHAVYSEAQRQIAVEGETVIVVFDYAAQKATRVPDTIRAAINRLEGSTLG